MNANEGNREVCDISNLIARSCSLRDPINTVLLAAEEAYVADPTIEREEVYLFIEGMRRANDEARVAGRIYLANWRKPEYDMATDACRRMATFADLALERSDEIPGLADLVALALTA